MAFQRQLLFRKIKVSRPGIYRLVFCLSGELCLKRDNGLALRQFAFLELMRILSYIFSELAPQNRQELAEEFVKFSDEIGVDQQIRFWGENSNPYSRNYYDFALVPSNMPDPFPTTVLEAMSIGLPVIATNNGGAKEAIIDNVTGLLIDPDSPSQLALGYENADGSQ